MDIITTHINSDFDGLGAMIAARKLYPGAVCVFPGSQERSLRQFFLAASTYASGFARAKNVDLGSVRRLIVVDVDDASRIGRFGELVGRPGVEVHVYDHHMETPAAIPAAVSRIERVGATTTILTEIIRERRIPLDPAEATVMLLGIFEDTGGLTFTSTTPRDFEAAGYLLSQGADLTAVREFITPELTSAQVALLDELLKARRTLCFHGVCVTVTEAATEGYVGDIAALAHKMCDMENLDALVMYVRMEDRVHIVCRSRVPEVDVSAIARHFGGGGHPEAASATVSDRTIIEVRDEVERLLAALVKPRLTARDICTSPVKTADAADTLAAVRDILNRYHINALPVMRGGKLAGLLTRLIVERALQHGLDAAKAEDYMITEFSQAAPDTPLDRVRELVVDGRQRFLPVVEDGELVGAITRTDLLMALTPLEPAGEPEAAAREARLRNVRKMLSDLVAPDVLARLAELGRAAVELDMRAYLVGGMVRDLLLRVPNLDVDIVVEGDGIALAREIARRWEGTVHPHKAFGTAKVLLPDGFRFDVATARTEYYERPAALPTVEQSNLKLDLSRRDFTINTLALRLEPDRFGDVIDFFGGLRDLKDRTLRILHNLSFVEDPTRVLRAVRFSLRFGFQIGHQTKKLLRSAVAMGFLAQGRGPRLFREWRMLFEEAEPAVAAEKLAEYGILKAFHPSLRWDAGTRKRFDAVHETVAWYQLLYLERGIEAWKVYFLALLEPLADDEVAEWARAFGVEEREGAWFRRARASVNHVLAELRRALAEGALSDSRIHRICSGAHTESLLYALSRTEDDKKRKAISRYHTRLASVRTHLGGRDLKELGIPPGPRYRAILRELLDRKLDGLAATREEERAWVLENRGNEFGIGAQGSG